MTGAGTAGPGRDRTEIHFDPAQRSSNSLGGTVYGPAVQARSIDGGVHIHEPALRLPPPNQLPPPVRLTGRDEDAGALDAARASGLILVTGQPGIGKTALAVQWGHSDRADYPDGALFADLHGYAPDGPASASEVLGRFLRALGLDPRQVSADLAELTGLYRSLLIDKRMLVVLDDALNAAQVMPLLPPSPESMAVVTSRLRLGGLTALGGRVVQLGRLNHDAAVELLARQIGDDRVDAQPHAARQLVELCARVPLPICVAGARLAARTRWPVSEMVEAMRYERERLAALRMEDDMAVRSALDISYRALPEAAARMYRLVSLFPGQHFDSWVAAATAAVAREEAKRLLGTLTDANLLDDIAGGQYTYHDLTRLHARAMAELAEPAPACDEAIRRMLDFYLDAAGDASLTVTPYRGQGDLVLDIRRPPAEPLTFADARTALDWLDAELPNLMAVARLAADRREGSVAWQLADAAWPVFLYRGRDGERLRLTRLGLESARECGAALGEAKMLYRLSTALIDAGQFEQAEECLDQSLTAWRRLGRADRVAGSLRRLGYLAMARGRPGDAAGWLLRAVAGYRELGDDRHVAVSLGDLADALIETGQAQEAIAALREAALLLADGADAHSQGRVQTRLGRAHELAGNLSEADDCLRQALDLLQAAGSAQGTADVLLALGDVASRAGQADKARARYTEAQRVLASLGSRKEAQVIERLAGLDRLGPA
jgi:tetratricopeptide (TPR) repeat protein